MKNNNYLTMLLAMLWLLASCGDDDDKIDSNITIDSDGETKEDTRFFVSMPYSVKVTPTIPFTEADVAMPLAIDIDHAYISGKLQLQNTDGVFAGTLQVDTQMSSDFYVQGTLYVPPADGENVNADTVSLDNLKAKCGHYYLAGFEYGKPDDVSLSDNMSYFLFVMSPLQHKLEVNAKEYTMSKDGKLWIALESSTPLVTNFYKVPYDEVKAGVDTINRSGLVDLGIVNTLWADKNVGAVNYQDYGMYSAWDRGSSLVSSPLELPQGGDDYQNDFLQLYEQCDWVWGDLNGKPGYYVFRRGGSDVNKDPYIFLPAAGRNVSGTIQFGGVNGNYWTVSMNTSTSYSSYNLFFDEEGVHPLEYYYRNVEFALRPICRTNSSNQNNNNGNQGDEHDVEYVPPYFPFDAYDISKVVAWYGHQDYYEKEDCYRFVSLYLLNNGTFVSTINKRNATTGVLMSIVELTGTFEITSGTENIDYANATATAKIAEMQDVTTYVDIKDGKCSIYGVEEQFTMQKLEDLPK